MMERSKHRSDQTERIEEIIDDTQEHLNEARAFENEHAEALSEEEMQRIEEKNDHRKESMESMRAGIQERGSNGEKATDHES
ncbi:small acid-soluble spore protein Tlp [Salicibibacter halophilus]|uniref:Small acid-soluble spore protein Tlp n=1 Tax=Salicibibacter halophilus TaxID=2502791 RepID=A0A514LHP4_9BACI|nr:small acid-soluble spore protein Tlp [Salicibibacter halophilus]QDI91378.1 small acid-soluble spore protein Tlp [Salicibibacter halophilus]